MAAALLTLPTAQTAGGSPCGSEKCQASEPGCGNAGKRGNFEKQVGANAGFGKRWRAPINLR